MSDPTTCPVCHCDDGAHWTAVHLLATRLTEVENRSPVKAKPSAEPVPMRLPCPGCGVLHLDVGEFAMKPHHTHSCQACGLTWRPAVVPTVGVQFLPGFKNDPAPPPSAEPTPAPVASGASVPDGYVLGEGWMKSYADYECSVSVCTARAVFELTSDAFVARGDEPGMWAACQEHAVEMGALVPVEPPKAETAQAAEPSAPVGFRVVGRSGPGVEQNDGDWIALARMVDGVALPSCTSTEPRRAWHAPSGPSTCRSTWDAGCYDILEPIADPADPPESNQTYLRVDCKVRTGRSCHHEACQPAAPPVAAPCDRCDAIVPHTHGAPPVAAKLSEHSPGPWRSCTASHGNCQCGLVWSLPNDMPVATVFRGDDEVGAHPEARRRANAALIAAAPETAAKVAALETAHRTLEMELDAAKRDRGQLREQLNVARREADTAKAENEALRGKLDAVKKVATGLGAGDREWLEKTHALEARLATRDRRIALLEASHREDVERAVREERERCDWLKGLLRRAITYAREDRMKTPGVTRLARVLEEAERAIASRDPAPKVGG